MIPKPIYLHAYSDMTGMDTTDRFSDRVPYYIEYRPGYPQELIELLQRQYSLLPEHEVADIGAGVGHSTRLFTDFGCYVYGIEPNAEMCQALIKEMKHVPNFSARLKTASDTDLDTDSIDVVVCAQSFHWFSVRAARTEFARILNDKGIVVLMWNNWQQETKFGQAYTNLLEQHSIDYEQVQISPEQSSDDIDYLYNVYEVEHFEHSQYFDLEGLKGRYLSSSYALLPGMDGHNEAMEAVEVLFDEFATDGEVEFPYTCTVYHGRL